jgi:mono/diheme cytochrome c family protein
MRALTAFVLSLALLAACGGGHVPLPTLTPATIGDTTGLVRRGEYLVRYVANCGHCHAADPKKDSNGPLSGGMEFKNWRLGTIRASNLTPDSTTGIGVWSDAEIVRAIRNGEDRDGEVLAPVMPYASFNGMSDRDALAIVRYLRTLPPVRNVVKSDHNLAYRIGEWFFLKPTKQRSVKEPTRAAHAEYGRYLVHHVALCADCHTPRGGLQGEPRVDLLLAGEPDPPKSFPANPANVTPDTATGIGEWTEADFLRTLRTGEDPDGEELDEFMPWRQFGHMTDDDLRAIYRYLRTIRPIKQAIPR